MGATHYPALFKVFPSPAEIHSALSRETRFHGHAVPERSRPSSYNFTPGYFSFTVASRKSRRCTDVDDLVTKTREEQGIIRSTCEHERKRKNEFKASGRTADQSA